MTTTTDDDHRDDFDQWEAEVDEDSIPDIPRAPWSRKPTTW